MLVTVKSGAVLGIHAYPVTVEVDIADGVQIFHIVGLPDGAIRESRLRVPSAVENAGFEFPRERLTINLAPADVRKDGTAFDLPIAVGVLAGQGYLPGERLPCGLSLDEILFAGELSLTGEVRPIRGALSMASMARDLGFRAVFLPEDNAAEAALVPDLDVLGVRTLSEVVTTLLGQREWTPRTSEAPDRTTAHPLDFADVAGHGLAKFALEIAAAGGHNVLMVGPPGSGKSMLARRLPTILPPMSFEEAIVTTKVFSVTGLLRDGLMVERPFRAPHHTISDVGLIGGGSGIPRPGEISLAHNGVLFLDELPEFRRATLEALRQPIENGSVTVSRSMVSVDYPAQVMLVAAMNPCPCGYFGTPKIRRCTCSAEAVRNYRNRVSGPMLDRIDLHVDVPLLPYDEIRAAKGATSADIRQRVVAARDVQTRRFGDHRTNATMAAAAVREHCALDAKGHAWMASLVDTLGLSGRAHDRLLKVARTIADLEGHPQITTDHLSQAASFRGFSATNHRGFAGAQAH